MTREEAEYKLLEGTDSRCTPAFMRDFIDSAEALGMLKLDEPPDVAELVKQAGWWTRIGGAVEVSPQSMGDAVKLIGAMKAALELSR